MVVQFGHDYLISLCTSRTQKIIERSSGIFAPGMVLAGREKLVNEPQIYTYELQLYLNALTAPLNVYLLL